MKFTSKHLRILVSVVLLGLIAWCTDWPSFAATVRKLRIEFWLICVGILCVTQVVSAVRWRMFADALGFTASLPRLTAFYFIGMFFNLLLPTSMGGDVVRAYYLNARSGRPVPAFLAVFLDRLSGLLVLVALACLGVVLSPATLPVWISLSVWGITAALVCGFFFLVVLSRRDGTNSKRLRELAFALQLLKRPRLLLATTLLSVYVQVANVVIVITIGFTLGLSAPAEFYWVLVPLVTLLTLLPISINGMGVREGATALLLAPFGVNRGAALSLALAWFAVHAVVSLLGGLVYMFGRFPKPAVSGSSDEVPHGSVDHHSDQGREREYRPAA